MWFKYRQNNTGGYFVNPVIVLIEAKDYDEADLIAIDKTPIYFDGVDLGKDCSCCGDRWYSAKWERDKPSNDFTDIVKTEINMLEEIKGYIEPAEMLIVFKTGEQRTIAFGD